MTEPPDLIVSLACDLARRSPCVKSKRGVVIFELAQRGGSPPSPLEFALWSEPTLQFSPAAIIHGTGFNGPPRPFRCDGSAACRKDCGVLCMHAEMRAILGAQVPSDFARATGEPSLNSKDLELVHVKVDDDGKLVAGKGPCCELCSRMILDVDIATVWLYEAATSCKDHLPGRCGTCHRQACLNCRVVILPESDWEKTTNVTGDCTACAPGDWHKYTAAEFHRKTLETLGFHISKLETTHTFYSQHRSRYCAACGEESYHPVHKP